MKAHILALTCMALVAACKKGDSGTKDSGGDDTEETADVQVDGEITIDDGDLTYVEPSATTLRLLADASPSYDLLVTESGSVDQVVCEIPIMAESASRGTFSKLCPGLGARTLTAYLRKSGKLNQTIVLTLPDSANSPAIDVGRGTLTLAIMKSGIDLTSTTAGDALNDVAAVVAAVGAAATDVSLTGTWAEQCVEDAQTTAECRFPSVNKYFEEVDIDGKSYVRVWKNAESAAACSAAISDPTQYKLVIGSTSIGIGLDSAASYTESLDKIYAKLSTALKTELRNSSTDNVAFETMIYCADPTLAHCVASGTAPYDGLTQIEINALRNATHSLVSAIPFATSERLTAECSEPTTDDLLACKDGYDQRIKSSTSLCLGAGTVTGFNLGLEITDAGKIVKSAAPAGFGACTDLATIKDQNLRTFCDFFKKSLKDLALRVDSTGKLVADPYSKPAGGYLASCPVIELLGQPDACQEALLAKSQAEQLETFAKIVLPLSFVQQACPNTAAPDMAATPEETAVVLKACQTEFLAMNAADQMAVMKTIGGRSGFTAMCADKTFAAELYASTLSSSCTPGAFHLTYFSTCSETGCSSTLSCWHGKDGSCVEQSPTDDYPPVAPSNFEQEYAMRKGLRGSMALLEDRTTEYPEVDGQTSEEMTCFARSITSWTIKADSADTLSSIHDGRGQALCGDEKEPSQNGNAPKGSEIMKLNYQRVL